MPGSAITAPTSTVTPSRRRVYATLALGVIAVSTAALFIRLAQGSGASSLAIAAGRLAFASLIIVPIALLSSRAELQALNARAWVLASAVGGLLALHFWLWFLSLELISVALSTALVSATPVWVALGAWVFRGERLTRVQMLGLSLSFCGSVALAFSTEVSGERGKSLALGCALAVGGAWAIAGNMLIGVGLRAKLPVRAYAALSYGWAAVWLLVAVVVTGTPIFGLAPGAYAAMAALALVPQLIGHTALNWALPFVGATTVAVSVLAEPIGAAFIAAAVLGESVTFAMALCFAVTLVGILLVTVNPSKK